MATNSLGVPVSSNGYSLCQVGSCNEEVTDLSKEVSVQYAVCKYHRNNRSSTKGDGTMSKKTSKYRDPAKNIQDMLQDSPLTRVKLISKMRNAGYKDSTINAQLFNLRHWKGCIVGEDGISRNPDFVREEKAAVEKTPAKASKKGIAKAKGKAVQKQAA